MARNGGKSNTAGRGLPSQVHVRPSPKRTGCHRHKDQGQRWGPKKEKRTGDSGFPPNHKQEQQESPHPLPVFNSLN